MDVHGPLPDHWVQFGPSAFDPLYDPTLELPQCSYCDGYACFVDADEVWYCPAHMQHVYEPCFPRTPGPQDGHAIARALLAVEEEDA